MKENVVSVSFKEEDEETSRLEKFGLTSVLTCRLNLGHLVRQAVGQVQTSYQAVSQPIG